MKKCLFPAVLTLVFSAPVWAQMPPADPHAMMPMPSYEELMRERNEHQKHMQAFMEKMRATQTPEERQKLMEEHVQEMEAEMRRMDSAHGMPSMPAMPAMPEFQPNFPAMPPMGDPSMGYMPMPNMPGMNNSPMDARMKIMHAYAERMQAAKTPEERQQIMAEQKQAMHAYMAQRGARMGQGRPPHAAMPMMMPRNNAMNAARMSPIQEVYKRIDELEKKVDALQQKVAQ
jgi:hypothetical protein